MQKLAGAVGVAFSGAHRLQGVQPTHGGVLALLAVPRAEAMRWLRGSGCGGLFVRPFWTKDTAPALQRQQSNLLYLKGRRADAARVWGALHEVAGVYGVLPAEKDLAVRISAERGAAAGEVQARIRAALQDPQASVRQPTPGATWWRLGPLTDAEVFRVRELISATGLAPLRDEVRLGGVGQFRRVAYFQATGQPTRLALDDGGWGRSTSSARLTPATPPPQRRPVGLPVTATWAGPREAALSRSPDAAPKATSPPSPTARGPPAGSTRGSRAAQRAARKDLVSSAPAAAPSSAPLAAPAEPVLDALLREMRGLRAVVERQELQLQELRRENAALRAQLATPGRAGGGQQQAHIAPFQHQPYAVSPPPHRLEEDALLSQDARIAAELAAAEPLTPRPTAPDPAASMSMVDPEDVRGRGRDASELTPEKPALKKAMICATVGAQHDA